METISRDEKKNSTLDLIKMLDNITFYVYDNNFGVSVYPEDAIPALVKENERPVCCGHYGDTITSFHITYGVEGIDENFLETRDTYREIGNSTIQNKLEFLAKEIGKKYINDPNHSFEKDEADEYPMYNFPAIEVSQYIIRKEPETAWERIEEGGYADLIDIDTYSVYDCVKFAEAVIAKEKELELDDVDEDEDDENLFEDEEDEDMAEAEATTPINQGTTITYIENSL